MGYIMEEQLVQVEEVVEFGSMALVSSLTQEDKQ
jgi:hypothetical protein